MSALLALALAVAPQGFVTSDVVVESRRARLALRDVDGDRRLDLVSVEPAGVRLFYQREDGTFPAKDDADRAWPEGPLGWDLVDWDGDGTFELLTLDGAGTVRLSRARGRGALEPAETLLEESGAFLPPGIRRLRCARDVDGDGALDLVLPSGSRFLLYLRKPGGATGAPRELRFEASVRAEVGDPEQLSSRVAQDITIPWFRVEDLDGDGLTDVVSETRDRVAFHLASPELPAEPTWTLDLAALRASVPKKEGFDFDDLVSNLTPAVRWRVAEVDGEAPAELFVQTWDTLKVYAGGARRGTRGGPSQVLRASGPILYFFVRDTNGDGRPELQIVRSETLSLGRVLRWLVLPGELDFDVYTYANDGEAFDRKPWKRTTLALEIPRLLSIEERIEELTESFSARADVPARAFALDADGVRDDVVDVVDGALVFHRGVLPAGFDESIPGLAEGDLDRLVEHFVLSDLDALEDGGVRTFGIDDLFDLDFSRGYELRTLCGAAEPALRLPLDASVAEPRLTPCDLRGDGIEGDLVVWGRDEDRAVRLRFLRRRD